MAWKMAAKVSGPSTRRPGGVAGGEGEEGEFFKGGEEGGVGGEGGFEIGEAGEEFSDEMVDAAVAFSAGLDVAK